MLGEEHVPKLSQVMHHAMSHAVLLSLAFPPFSPFFFFFGLTFFSLCRVFLPPSYV